MTPRIVCQGLGGDPSGKSLNPLAYYCSDLNKVAQMSPRLVKLWEEMTKI